MLNSTLDSDRDSDPSWNGGISLSHQNLVCKKTLTGNTDNGWEDVRPEREGSSATSGGRKRQTPETPATLREDAAVTSVVSKPSNQSGAAKASKEISAKRASNETKENATDKLTPASNETNAGRSKATDKLTSEPVHVVCRGRPGKSIATVTTAGSDSLAHSKAKSKTLLTTSRAYKKRSGPSDVGTSVTASKKKIVSDVGTSVTTSKKKIVSDVGTSITASKKKIVSDVGTFSAVKKGKVDNAVEEGRPASRAENGGKAGRGKAGMGTVKKTVSCDLTGVESAITAETPALPGRDREMRGKGWSGVDSTQGEEGLQSPTVSTLTLSPGRETVRGRGRGTGRGMGMGRKKVTEKVYQPVDDEFDMPSVDSRWVWLLQCGCGYCSIPVCRHDSLFPSQQLLHYLPLCLLSQSTARQREDQTQTSQRPPDREKENHPTQATARGETERGRGRGEGEERGGGSGEGEERSEGSREG